MHLSSSTSHLEKKYVKEGEIVSQYRSMQFLWVDKTERNVFPHEFLSKIQAGSKVKSLSFQNAFSIYGYSS